MSTPLSKSKPPWLTTTDPDAPDLSPHYRRSVMYYRKLWQAWPEWAAADPRFKEIYDEAKQRREDGEDVQVDHVVPISSKIVSGLHVPWNLQIITTTANNAKSNKWWPGCPFEMEDLFPETLQGAFA